MTGERIEYSLMVERLIHGGYVIRQGYSKGDWQQELAAFTTIEEALAWIKEHLK